MNNFNLFFVYFDKSGITFFPLDLNNNYKVIGKTFISWGDIINFCFKKGLLLEDTISIQMENIKIEMKIPKSKSMNKWVKDNNEYLINNNHFYTN